MRRYQLLISVAVISTVSLHGGRARADCAFTGDTARCTGDLYSGRGVELMNNFANGRATQALEVSGLVRDIEVAQNPYAVLLSWTSGRASNSLDGVNSLGLRLSFDGQSYGVNGATGRFRFGIAARSTGASGADSGNATTTTAPGGHGGAGGPVTVDMTSGYVGLEATQATGVLALSEGGAGGSAGRAESFLGEIRSGVGGTGGFGRTAEVTVRSQGISVTGDMAQGVVARSSAGRGGTGGNISGSGMDNTAGAGGHGGEGGRAHTTVWTGPVTVTGRAATGIGSFSNGGFGGDGGTSAEYGQPVRGGAGGAGGNAGATETNVDAVTVTATGDQATAIASGNTGGTGGAGGRSLLGLSTALGGAGGAGGAGGYTSLTLNGGSATARGDNATALSAVSTGGDGGRGGAAQDHFETDDRATGATGGRGGAGGIGDTVYVAVQDSHVEASGAGATGIEVRSTGGHGGDGGDGAAGGALANGGRGGAGGDASRVELLVIGGEITLEGEANSAVLAQSHGGDGGTGGAASSIAGSVEGGLGGSGGSSGAVTVTTTNRTKITTTGSGAQHGILAESLAGQGGTGGGGSTGVGRGTGGSGGRAGANAALVTASIAAEITTAGAEAYGLVARSYGGAGGDGGAGTGVIGDGAGGAGGGSSAGGQVRLTFGGSVDTSGAGAGAILAQSIGGFSGHAGTAAGFLAFGAGSQSSGDGGSVTATVHTGTRLTTEGADANALMLQSVGGGGGVAGIEGDGGSGSGAGAAGALGGEGSAGGNGGAVTLTAGDIQIETAGGSSRGISATSHGGGGGDGGGAGGVVGIGGASGPGGHGGVVHVETQAHILTHGKAADGLHAQSIGGGGGSAEGTGGAVAVGGTGGEGGNSSSVTVKAGGSIQTEGRDADAVFAQSIGGGGGDGAWATAPDGVVSLAVGGQGGQGGDAGKVTFEDLDPATSGYLIRTTGDRARGIFAHSVGGGGGDGGQALTIADVNIAVGGSGGAGGDAGEVEVRTAATIETAGSLSNGLFAQSIGGGGGAGGQTVSVANGPMTVNVAVGGGGGAGGIGRRVAVATTGDITTTGQIADAITAQSLGGGGGSSGQTISVTGVTVGDVSTTVGGDGGSGNHAGEVEVSSTGHFLTTGDSSHGILAQSVGGGGGASKATGHVTAVGGTGAVATTVGGQGGAAGDGDDVTVTADGRIHTKGDISEGILAMSAGGGGGTSGETYSVTTLTTASIQTTVGGSGGASGSAGDVTVTTGAEIRTEGDQSAGISAQSVGGSGGKSGIVFDGSLSVGAVNTTVGGAGGAGGQAGEVTVTNSGLIVTSGSHSEAISAQSIGGGGGSAKGAIAGAVGVGAVDVTFGGDGGAAGTAGAVSVTSLGALLTYGDNSHGIVAQSQGGAGGHGGMSIEGSLTVGEFSGAANVTVGGAGGAGGRASGSEVTNGGDIQTYGDSSVAVIVQSVGGNGGIAGNVISGNVNFSSEAGGEVTVNVGGPGGDGATSGKVDLVNTGDILTRGHDSTGLMAQSIGGNGGIGGSVYSVSGMAEKGSSMTVGVDVGGDGGSGMDAEAVSVTNSGGISTLNDGAVGIFAQSIGGGGGRAGNVANANLDLSGATKGSTLTVNAHFDVGGDGGAGGHGRAVTLRNTGNITTRGESASGIVAQSIGGGGGYGGTASSKSFGLSTLCTLSKIHKLYECGAEGDTKVKVETTISIGGTGGAGSDGDLVDIENTATISTTGRLSHAIYAQSIGGGGGFGGEGGLGFGGWTAPTEDDDTDGDADGDTDALLGAADSGVGASVPGFLKSTNVEIAIGGGSGDPSNGGAVKITNSGTLATSGQSGYGVFAQSIGGGGGNGGAGSGGATNILTLGNSGSGGGTGGQVDVVNEGTIATWGEGGVGIFAQSLGGGGGTAGDVEKAITFSFLDLNIGAGVGLQENAGDGGDSSTVNVTSGRIWTSGEAAHGIVAQSTAGAGGITALSGLLEGGPTTFAGSNGAKGSSGDVNVTVDGLITVTGKQAHGIFAQSASGGLLGSDVVDATDTSGDITVTVNRDVVALGEGGRAILAQSSSLGRPNNGRIRIDVADGATVRTGEDSDETIAIFDGRDNVITNHGTIAHGLASGEGYVIRTNGIGALTVDNYGLIFGSVRSERTDDYEPSAVTIENRAQAEFSLGRDLSLGVGGRLNNAGLVTFGASDAPGHTTFEGQFSQSSSGQLGLSVMAAQTGGASAQADLLEITGGATLAGTVRVYMDVGENPLGGRQTTGAFLTTTEGLTNAGLSVAPSMIGRYSLNWETPGAVGLNYELNFASDTALAAIRSGNESLSMHLQETYAAGGLSREALNVLANISDPEAYRAAVASLSGAIYTDTQTSSLRAGLNFGEAMMSCSQREGSYRFLREDACGWLRVGYSEFTQEDTSDTLGFEEISRGISGGLQLALDSEWHLGGALSYDSRTLSKSGLMSGQGEMLMLGAVAKRGYGPMRLAASLSVGHGTYDIKRNLVTGEVARGDQEIWTLSGRLRAEYLIDGPAWFAKPRVDLGLHMVRAEAVSESGAGALSHQIDRTTDTYASLQPAVEFGGEWTNAAGTLFRPSMTLGLTKMLDEAGPTISSQFDGAPEGASAVSAQHKFDALYLDVGLGLEVLSTDNMVINAEAFGRYSDTTRQVGASVKVSIPF